MFFRHVSNESLSELRCSWVVCVLVLDKRKKSTVIVRNAGLTWWLVRFASMFELIEGN